MSGSTSPSFPKQLHQNLADDRYRDSGRQRVGKHLPKNTEDVELCHGLIPSLQDDTVQVDILNSELRIVEGQSELDPGRSEKQEVAAECGPGLDDLEIITQDGSEPAPETQAGYLTLTLPRKEKDQEQNSGQRPLHHLLPFIWALR